MPATTPNPVVIPMRFTLGAAARAPWAPTLSTAPRAGEDRRAYRLTGSGFQWGFSSRIDSDEARNVVDG